MKVEILVKPGSKQKGITTAPDGSLTVRLHARAHDGEANAALIPLLAKHYSVSKSRIAIVKGHKSKHKLIEILP